MQVPLPSQIQQYAVDVTAENSQRYSEFWLTELDVYEYHLVYVV